MTSLKKCIKEEKKSAISSSLFFSRVHKSVFDKKILVILYYYNRFYKCLVCHKKKISWYVLKKISLICNTHECKHTHHMVRTCAFSEVLCEMTADGLISSDRHNLTVTWILPSWMTHRFPFFPLTFPNCPHGHSRFMNRQCWRSSFIIRVIKQLC